MELFKLYFSTLDSSNRFKAIVSHSSNDEKEEDAFLPFVDEEKDWRTTLIKTLEAPNFEPKDFQQVGEQDWMVKVGLLTEDRKAFHPNLLKNIGQTLYQALFPLGGKLESILKAAVRLAEEKNTDLLIQLTFQEDSVRRSRFADYPWELLHDGKKFLAHRRITFSRYIAYESVQPNLPPTEKINVLLISSAAFDTNQELEKLTKDEQSAILQGLQKAQAKGHIKLSQLDYATTQCLRTYLTEHQGGDAPHVIHFDGHGVFGKRCLNQRCRTIHKGIKVDRCKACNTSLPEAQGYLVFETEQRGPDYVSAEEFGLLIQKTTSTDGATPSRGITLAVLSACQSGMSVIGDSVFNGTAQNLISHRVPAVVAMQYSVSVEGATKFAEQFYRSLGQKNSLALAVNQGREAMGLETQQWFRPVLYLRWRDNVGGQLFNIPPQSKLRQLNRKSLGLIGGAVTGSLLVLRFLGLLQGAELETYDQLMRLRILDEGRDNRLLIVQITDDDLNEQVKRNEDGQGTLKDETAKRLIEQLEKFKPRLIGFDLYRDFPATKQSGLAQYLRSNRLITVCKAPETDQQKRGVNSGTSAPPEVLPEQVGFSDFEQDEDQVVRRYLLAQQSETIKDSPCKAQQSFSLLLAQRYLQLEKNSNQYQYQNPFESDNNLLKLGQTVFPYIQPFTGGYQDADVSGYQLLLNYRARGAKPLGTDACSTEEVAKCLTVQDVLNNRLVEKDVKNKIVLIGITAKNAISDNWQTPYGIRPGVIVQAHKISQVLGTVLDKRSLIIVFPQLVEYLWILGCSLIGAWLAYVFRFSWWKVAIAGTGGVIVLYIICLGSLSWNSLWLPLIPSALVFVFTGATVLVVVYRPLKQASSTLFKK